MCVVIIRCVNQNTAERLVDKIMLFYSGNGIRHLLININSVKLVKAHPIHV
jgi:hypothetical protein